MSRGLRRRGHLLVLPVACTASARRLVQHGLWRMTVLMQVLEAQYLLCGIRNGSVEGTRLAPGVVAVSACPGAGQWSHCRNNGPNAWTLF